MTQTFLGRVQNGDFGYSYSKMSASVSVKEQADAHVLHVRVALAVARVTVSDMTFFFQSQTNVIDSGQFQLQYFS